MSPLTHLLGSWLIAAKTMEDRRDVRLAALAGILPDLDGLGLLVDVAQGIAAGDEPRFYYYSTYHHYLLHGWFGGVLLCAVLAAFARRKWRLAMVAFGLFHLHLLCDFLGSRGPTPEDLWPIFYLAPFSANCRWIWSGQLPLDGWFNQLLTWVLFFFSVRLALRRGDSFIGVINRWADDIFMRFLREAREKVQRRRQPLQSG